MAVHVSPATCTPIYVSYLRQTQDPFLDYYVDNTTLEVTFMAEGATVSVPSTCTSRSGISGGSVVSQTKDFEFHPHDVPQIINIFMGLIGVQLNDQPLVQLEQIDETKIERE